MAEKSPKERFLHLAGKIKRDGITDLMNYLDAKDFFTAPASTRYHGSHPQGLLMHSLWVYDLMKEINELTSLNIDKESILVCGLFHDVCKVDFYKEDSEEATSAQMGKLRSLCDGSKYDLPPKHQRTKVYVSLLIDAILKNKSVPEYKTTYKVEDRLPMGHGEKSVFIINKFMAITDEEALAIRWHLGGFDPAAWNSPMGNPSVQAFRENKLVALISGADILASYLMDEW